MTKKHSICKVIFSGKSGECYKGYIISRKFTETASIFAQNHSFVLEFIPLWKAILFKRPKGRWVYLKDVSLEYLRETPFKVEKYSCIAEMDTDRKYKINEEAEEALKND
ncbi:hypothetical protein FOF68_07530 [Lactobacillus jensenii]|uniref:hypothetical protein n=1 Tax=Lactobacillus TaxID=1578 RepID=UPI00065DE81C|nr:MULTISPECIES: hypothetical protein [Lactobacillus]APT14788.1 hypothetical protein BUE77_04935 [Lactobacillus jensenii]KAA9372013.1 hypothetical protein F6I07_03790 [Lactobacillus jensenii]MCW8082049.1 hypothetical protein [Lactobacillus jensenii]MCW8124781.1 hypothetical protein [Lactobacillus mulieris]MCZ3690636.1 hypothetical protein [Lactobacillus mulieris]